MSNSPDISRSAPPTPRIIALDAIRDEPVGGKAAGLAQLHAMGLRVPAGFAILGATPDRLPADLFDHYRALGGGRVAVRSSALDEDTADASWAGQYETILDVEGEQALEDAIRACLKSLESDRATAYHDLQHREGENAMSVVVQRMIAPRAAGVLFTVDPVTSRRAHAVIDAVEGLGEALVSGEATPDHYLVDRASGAVVKQTLVDEVPILGARARADLLAQALEAEENRGTPLDLEWAIDADGEIWWLQARPITTLEADLNELDSPLLDPDDVFTRCNVGEMFPGACTPLSFSFTCRGIDVGMQLMHVRIGLQREVSPDLVTMGMFYGHLFINLTSMSHPATQALGSSTDQLCLSLCGRRITEPEIKTRPVPPLWRRIPSMLRYARYVLSQKRARARLKQLVAELGFPSADASALAQWRVIDEKFPAIYEAMDLHLISSAGAGIMAPTLLGVISKGQDPTDEQHAIVAGLLAGAEDVESADIAAGAERIVAQLMRQSAVADLFAHESAEDALAWLRSADSGTAGEEFARYLARHGHRAIKELELRQPEWREDPQPLIASLQAAVRARLRDPAGSRGGARARSAVEPAEHGRAVAWLTRLAQQTVRSREETKSGLVAVTVAFKVAYREFARRAVAEGLLPDEDAVFFLTHDELGALVTGSNPALAESAVARRKVFPKQEGLEFPEVFAGVPEPVVPEFSGEPGDCIVTGSPVSRGVVVGIARVVRSPAEAEALREGEILVAPITDVGWTPYFSLISGLVTDVGSAVSHGAVVAREFGLPAVVNTRVGTRVFETGDRIMLDGDNGIVRLEQRGE